MNNPSPRIAIVWRGDRETRRTATPANNRYHRIFEELVAVGLTPEPAVLDEEFADEFLAQFLQVDAVLVWVNPLDDGKTRAVLDPLLRKVAKADRSSARIRASSSRWVSRMCFTRLGISAGASILGSTAPLLSSAKRCFRCCGAKEREC